MIMQSERLELVLSKEIIIWAAKGLENTLDLVFVEEGLEVIECKIRKDLHHRSDHYPVAIYIDFLPDLEPGKLKKRAWKSTDPDKVCKAAKRLNFTLSPIYSTMNIDVYLDQITLALQKVIEQRVPWKKPSPKAQSFWNSDCTKFNKTTKRLCCKYESSRNTDM